MNLNDSPAAGAHNQAELARRALKTLAERRLIPTPDTFSEVYYELSGRRAVSAQAALKELLKDLVRANRMAAQEAAQVNQAAGRHDWSVVREHLERALARRPGATGQTWPQLVAALLKQADLLHANWTRARKIDAVSRVIESSGDQADVALERLARLVESWGPPLASLPGRDEGPDAAPATAGASTRPVPPAGPDALPDRPEVGRAANATGGGERSTDRSGARSLLAGPGGDARSDEDATARPPAAHGMHDCADAWRQVAVRAVRLLEDTCPEGSAGQAALREFVTRHAAACDSGSAELLPRFSEAAALVQRQLAEQDQVRSGLQRLLALLCDNMKSLTPEEAWLAGQLEPIRALLAGPLTARQLAQAEQKLAGVIAQQAGARRSLQEAKVALKEMLATLIERIGAMGTSTGRFYEQVGAYQRELECANDLDTLSRVISGLLADTQLIRADIQASREELVQARRKVESYEARVKELERELTQVSTLVQKDALTQALNRRGLEDAFRIETARATRYGAPLSLLMLDLDDFKRLNDTLGHVAGDRALVHLAQTMQATLRPTDLVARLGGEEFTILFPATDLEEAAAAGERLLRELARRTFAFEGRSHPITFSAGCAQWRADEPLEDLIRRADATMYEAKRSGKNRVLKAGG